MTPPPANPAGLRARKCVRHPAREAAARCLDCAGAFCRECVSEHDGRLLCADCLAKAVALAARPARDFSRLRRAFALAAGLALTWLFFYGVGDLLVKIPVDFHQGTLWKPAAELRP